MIRIWHDEALRWLPLWLIITMLNTSVLLGLVLWRQATIARDLQPPAAWLLVIPWLAVSLYLIVGQVRTRCRRLEMALPIRARTLWRKHLAAVFSAGAIVLAGSLGVMALHAALLARPGRLGVLEIPFASLVGPLLAGLLLTAAIVNGLEPGLQNLRGRPAYWMRLLGALLGVLLLLLLLLRWPVISTVLCLALTLLVIWRAERALPAAFRLVPLAAGMARRPERVAASTHRPVGRWQIYRTVFRVLHSAPPWKQFTPWMLYGLVAVVGFVLAGGIDRWKELPELRFLYLPFGSYMLFAGIGVLTYNLYRLDSLPVSRRAILATLTLPGLVFHCAGYGLGWWARHDATSPPQLVDFHVRRAHVEIPSREGAEARAREVRTMAWVEVDPGFMGMSLAGEPPLLTAPWGETHNPWTEALFRGLPPVLYNPYNTPEETSPDFEALMLSRAIEEVYGRRIPPEELRDRYFVIEDDRITGLTSFTDSGPGSRVQGKPRGIPLLDDYPDLVAPPGGPETPVYLSLVLLPWLLLTSLFLSSLRAGRSSRFIRGVYWTGLAIPMLGLVLQALLSAFGLFGSEAGRGFLAIPIRVLGTHPVYGLITWAATVALIAACYWLALRRFEKAEIPTSPIQCSLVKWGSEE